MSKLTRDELEREIVTYDKQKLITQCLRLFDANLRLTETIQAQQEAGRSLDQDRKDLLAEVRRLKARSWIQVLNDKIRSKLKNP